MLLGVCELVFYGNVGGIEGRGRFYLRSHLGSSDVPVVESWEL